MSFTGTWRLNHERSRLQIPAPDTTIFTIEELPSLIRIGRTHVAKGQSDHFSIDLPVDGSQVVVHRGEQTIRSRCEREGDCLVFHSEITSGDKQGTNVVRYTVSADGSRLDAEERFRSADLNYDNSWVLDRQ